MFGKKKRIKVLEDRVDKLIKEVNKLTFDKVEIIPNTECTMQCGSGPRVVISGDPGVYATPSEAIKLIMDHLKLEFKHEEKSEVPAKTTLVKVKKPEVK